MRCSSHHRGRHLATGLLLAVTLFRAYVPAGFMPASGTPFLLEICPSGLDGLMHAHHHHHSGSHGDFENCPFGNAPIAAPVVHVIAFDPPGDIALQSPFASVPAQRAIQILRSQRARAPPTPA